MGDGTLFQICHEGDLTVEVSEALRRLRAEPNFDQSWEVEFEDARDAGVLARYLRMAIGGDAKLLVAPLSPTSRRDFLLVRHSLTPDADYRELHGALERLGWVLELPFDSTFIVDTDDRTEVHALGEALAQLCPDDSLMVTGIGSEFAWCTGGAPRPMLASRALAGLGRVRSF